MSGSDLKHRRLAWELCGPDALCNRAAEWDSLVHRARYPAFMRAQFLHHAIGSFGCEGGRLALGWAGAQLLAGGLLVPAGRFQWSTFQPSQLPLGAFVMTPGLQWDVVLPSILEALPAWSTSLGITQQDPRLVDRPMSGRHIDTLDYVATGWIDVAGSFEEFWQARGKNLRQNLKKQRRRLEEQEGLLSFEFIEHPDAVEAALFDFARLESSGWKAAEGTAITVDNAQGSFYRSVLRDFANQGAGFALRLALNGRPIAIDFGVRDDESMVILKTTYDETLKNLSPAQLLHEQAFEYIFRHRLVSRIEFYGRLMEWHQRWSDRSRMLYHVNYDRSPLVRRTWELLKRVRGGWHRRRSPANLE